MANYKVAYTISGGYFQIAADAVIHIQRIALRIFSIGLPHSHFGKTAGYSGLRILFIKFFKRLKSSLSDKNSSTRISRIYIYGHLLRCRNTFDKFPVGFLILTDYLSACPFLTIRYRDSIYF